MPSTSLNWLDGCMDGQKDRYKCPFALWSFSHSSHATYELKTCCVTNVLWTSTELPLVLTEAQGGQKPSAGHPAESPELPWRSLLTAGPLSDVSPTHSPPVTWISTLLAPPLPISANYSVTLHSPCCPRITLYLRCLAEGSHRAGAGERLVFDMTLFPVSASFTGSGGYIQDTAPLCGQQTHKSQSITFYLCISVNKVFFLSSHTCTTLIMLAITHS